MKAQHAAAGEVLGRSHECNCESRGDGATDHHRSTNAFNRPNPSSHCSDTDSRYFVSPSIGRGSSSNKLSRPSRTPRTTPAASSTRRCFVIACRVSFEPAVRCEIDRGRPAASFTTSANRVSSPSAANINAGSSAKRAAALRLGRDMLLNVFHLLRPATIVSAEELLPRVARNIVETRLGKREQRALLRRLQPELHQGSWSVRVV